MNAILWIGPGVLTVDGVIVARPGLGLKSIIEAAAVAALGAERIAQLIASGLARELPAGDEVIEVPHADGIVPLHTKDELRLLARHLIGRTFPAMQDPFPLA